MTRVRPRRAWIQCLGLLVLLPAAGSPAVAPAASLDPGDARLDPRVTLRLSRVPLAAVLAELGRQTRVTLGVDPELAGEPVLVQVSGQPAREVLNHLAKLLDLQWTRSGERGRYSYLLSPTRESRAREMGLRDRDWRQALQALAADVARAAQEREDEQQSARRLLLQLLSLVPPEQQPALQSGRTVYFRTTPAGSGTPLPAETARELRRLQQAHYEELSRRGVPVSAPLGLAETVQRARGTRVGLWVTPRISPDALVAGLRSKSWMLFPPEERLHLAAYALPSGAGVYRQPVPKAPSPEDAAARWGGDPLLGARRSFKMAPLEPGVDLARTRTMRRLHEVLPELARTFGVNIIADAYLGQRLPPQPPNTAQELPLYEVLNRHALPSGEWTREGDFLRVRSHTWYFDRLSDIPDPVVREWAAHLRRLRRLDLEHATRLVLLLRDEQLLELGSRLREEGVYLGDGPLSLISELSGGDKDVLRAYGTLPPRQQKSLQAGGELPLEQLPPASRRWLEAALEQLERERDTGVAGGLPPGALSLRTDRVERTVTSNDGEEIRYRYRGLDGSAFAGNGGMKSSAAPPGFAEGGQILQELTFRYRFAADRALEFQMRLPCAYFAPVPEAKPARPMGPGPAAE